MESIPPLLRLPIELLHEILGYLDAFDLTVTSRTCRALVPLSCDDKIWQPLVNSNVAVPLTSPWPCKSFRQLYVAHHPCWFLPRQRIWFADTAPSGKLVIARYNPHRGNIEAHAVTAHRSKTEHTHEFWAHDPGVAIINFEPHISLDLNRPVVNLELEHFRSDGESNGYPSDRGYAPPSIYSKETLMNTFAEAGLFSSFSLCRSLPAVAIHEGTRLWPPLRFPADSRTRNETSDGFHSIGHRPSRLADVSKSNFRLRKWVEYTGRRSNAHVVPIPSPNGLSATLGKRDFLRSAAGFASSLGVGMSIRMPEDITTFATLPQHTYTPTPQKPWQGIWVGDYGGHGCEFLVITQPDKEDERPLPAGLDWLRDWFLGGRQSSVSSTSSYASAQEERVEPTNEPPAHVPTGRLEAIKLTGDPNIPRGEYTFIAPDIGEGGFVRIADEKPFCGARVVRSAGHMADRGFVDDQYTPSQLILISNDRLAQFWEGYGHISYFQRVDMDALIHRYAS